jgi:hypothetical protein
VPILEGLKIELFSKCTMSSTLSLKSLKNTLRNIMWEVAPLSRSHASFQELYKVLNIYSVTPILQ